VWTSSNVSQQLVLHEGQTQKAWSQLVLNEGQTKKAWSQLVLNE